MPAHSLPSAGRRPIARNLRFRSTPRDRARSRRTDRPGEAGADPCGEQCPSVSPGEARSSPCGEQCHKRQPGEAGRPAASSVTRDSPAKPVQALRRAVSQETSPRRSRSKPLRRAVSQWSARRSPAQPLREQCHKRQSRRSRAGPCGEQCPSGQPGRSPVQPPAASSVTRDSPGEAGAGPCGEQCLLCSGRRSVRDSGRTGEFDDDPVLGRILMYCWRILPLMCASTRCPFSNSTRNIALGNGSTTRPSTS